MFEFLDPNGTVIKNDFDLGQNELIKDVIYDIITTDGTTVINNFQSGKSRTFTCTESQNISVFGHYEPNFGIRSRVSNSVNSQIFTGIFFVYANVPYIDQNKTIIYDGKFDPYSINKQVFNEVELNLVYENTQQYLKFDRIDIFADTNPLSMSDLPYSIDAPYSDTLGKAKFLYSQPVLGQLDSSLIKVKPNGLLYNTEYYFAIVPYSQIGSGTPYFIGPHIFTKEIDEVLPENVIQSNQFELISGPEVVNMDLITGNITVTDESIIDQIEINKFNTILYTVQIKDTHGVFRSSQLKLVVNSSTTTLLEESLSNDGSIKFGLNTGTLYHYLTVSGVAPEGFYKIFKTSI
jgi:hypothetical protein